MLAITPPFQPERPERPAIPKALLFVVATFGCVFFGALLSMPKDVAGKWSPPNAALVPSGPRINKRNSRGERFKYL